MASTSDIRNGLCIKHNHDIYKIIEFLHVKPGKGPAFVRTKLKSLTNGKVLDNTFSAGHKIDVVRVETHTFQYLYAEGDQFHFMNNESFEQITLNKDILDAPDLLKEGTNVMVQINTETDLPLSVDMPASIVLEVTYSEPGAKGNTATNATKPATVETGATINVPLFINEGDKIKIDTATGSYMERVKEKLNKYSKEHTLKEIASIIGCEFVGNDNFPVLGMNEIHVVEPGDIVFVDHPKYYDKALQSAATIVLINKSVDCPEGKALLISDDPFRDFNKLTNHFRPFQASNVSISASAKIGAGSIIQPNCFVGNNVTIGINCLIHSNVSIYDNTVIGDNVIIHAGTILGADAFYYKKRPDGFDQLISGGRVVIENNVGIGALCTIDKGVTGDTTIGEGTKIDNQVHVGHDTIIGKKCLIASQTGIAGCVVIEDEVTLWGQVGTTSGITIGSKAVVMGQTGVTKSIEGGKSYFGTPVEESREKLKQLANLKRLPELLNKLNQNEG